MKTDIRTLYYFYTSIYRERSEYSKKCADLYFERYIAPYLGERDVKDITPSELQMVLNTLKGKSHTAISIMYGDLMLIMKKAYTDGLIDRDPTGAVMKPKAKATEKRRALTPIERETVIAVAQIRRQYYAILFMMLCGCRPSEAYEVKGKDIVKIDGRPFLHIRGRKTANSDRLVPIPKDLYQIIRKTPQNAYVSPTDGGNKQGNNSKRAWEHFRYHLDRYLGSPMYRNAIIESKTVGLTPYCLRHEYCTELARKGIDIRTAQKLMGHSSIDLTANIYTNLEVNDIAKDVILFE